MGDPSVVGGSLKGVARARGGAEVQGRAGGGRGHGGRGGVWPSGCEATQQAGVISEDWKGWLACR